MNLRKILTTCLFALLLAFSLTTELASGASACDDCEYLEVEVLYLATHMEDFCGQKVRTVGAVSFMISYYMYEDFWLSRVIPVVVRFAGLSVPPENASVEVFGIIEYCRFEGGFFYLNAQKIETITIPEFSFLLILPLSIIATLAAIIISRRKHYA